MLKRILICLITLCLFLCGCEKAGNNEVAPPSESTESTESTESIESTESTESTVSKPAKPVYDGDPKKLRVMSYNLMPNSEQNPVYERIPHLNKFLADFKPDIVATAEADLSWRGLLQSTQLGPVDRYSYTFAKVSSDKSHISSLGILYNTARFTLLEHEAHFFEDYNDTEFHPGFYIGIFWAHFKDNITGKEFIATTTHWQFSSGKEPSWANTTRRYQANESADVINSLKKKYKCPVIAMGDFNCNSTEDYRKYIANMNSYNISVTDFGDNYCMIPFEKKTGFISAKYYKGATVTEEAQGYWCIDNVFIDEDEFKVSFFDIYRYANKEYGNISDHPPLYADLIYK